MLPLFKRQGSHGASLYAMSRSPDDDSSPSGGMTRGSPFADILPHSHSESDVFSYRAEPPVSAEDFNFKRLRSTDSFTTDTSPTSIRRVPLSSPAKIRRVTIRRYPPKISEDDTGPMLRLGDEGRSKLKSALSEEVRNSPEIKADVDAIGKIRLASMQQLLRMAQVAGLFDYATQLAKEHELGKTVKRSS